VRAVGPRTPLLRHGPTSARPGSVGYAGRPDPVCSAHPCAR